MLCRHRCSRDRRGRWRHELGGKVPAPVDRMGTLVGPVLQVAPSQLPGGITSLSYWWSWSGSWEAFLCLRGGVLGQAGHLTRVKGVSSPCTSGFLFVQHSLYISYFTCFLTECCPESYFTKFASPVIPSPPSPRVCHLVGPIKTSSLVSIREEVLTLGYCCLNRCSMNE